MISLDEARAHVLAGAPTREPKEVALDDALGLVLAAPIDAPEAVPPFANTAMDGFAVRAADTQGASEKAPVHLEVVGTLPAGTAPDRAVGPGEAIRIMTGAPMPPDADAVVMVELTRADDEAGRVAVLAEVPAGNHVRGIGEDLSAGDRVFGAGEVLSPAHLAVLASVGCARVLAYPRLSVGALSTGDELVQGAGPLEPGQIRDSNRRALLALIEGTGCVPVDLGLVADDEASIGRAIEAGVAACDALVTSGGVSMGDYDYVKVVLDRLGDMRWMQVAIKPAKPLAFGTVAATPVFGLPGNPVSSLISFEVFARPALRQMMGFGEIDRPRVWGVADEPLSRGPDGKTHFMRVAVHYGADHRYHVRSAGGQGSHQMAAMAAADALAVIGDGDGVAVGGDVEFMALREVYGPPVDSEPSVGDFGFPAPT